MPITRKRPENRMSVWRPRKSVRLHLDEIDEVVAILQQFGDVWMESPEFAGQVESAADLKLLGVSELKQLTLIAGANSDEFIAVGLGSPTRVVFTPKENLSARGAANRIEEVLNGRQRRFDGAQLSLESSLFHDDYDDDYMSTRVPSLAGQHPLLPIESPPIAWPLPLRVVFALIISLVAGIAAITMTGERKLMRPEGGGPPQEVIRVNWVVIGLLVLVAFVLIFSPLIKRALIGPNPYPLATVVLAFRSEAPSWWEQNRTQVYLGLLTNAVVGVAFFILGLWLAD